MVSFMAGFLRPMVGPAESYGVWFVCFFKNMDIITIQTFVFQVTELDYNPRDEDDTEFNDSDDIDLINLQFLEELETSCT